jgi:hypothetical protein
MSIGHFFDAGGYVDHGDASPLFPVERLAATVHTHRDAERVLAATPGESVLVVRPTGLASSYTLTQRPLTAVEVASLDDEPREHLRAVGVDLTAYEVVQIGRQSSPSENRSFAEF